MATEFNRRRNKIMLDRPRKIVYLSNVATAMQNSYSAMKIISSNPNFRLLGAKTLAGAAKIPDFADSEDCCCCCCCCCSSIGHFFEQLSMIDRDLYVGQIDLYLEND
uniref:Uncharacterized protein n=1 Tax=Romanomermis culicivorax TaxID=13658 RepID=A0A915KF12_ROMCU